MEIGAAEAESADSGAARGIVMRQPGAFFSGDVKRGVSAADFVKRFCYLDGRGDYLVVKCQRCLDEPCSSGRSLCMADLRLYRTESAPWSFGLAEDFTQGRDFYRITDSCSGPVGLKQTDAVRRYACRFVGVEQRALLAVGTRRIDRITLAVT